MIKHQRECLRFCVGTADTSNLHEKAKQQRAGPPATLRKKNLGLRASSAEYISRGVQQIWRKTTTCFFFFFCPLFQI